MASSSVRISCVSESLSATELTRLAAASPEKVASVGELIPPANGNDARKRVARFSSMSWSSEFSDDGSDVVETLIDQIGIDWALAVEAVIAKRTSWTVGIALDSESFDDQVRFEGHLRRMICELAASVHVKVF